MVGTNSVHMLANAFSPPVFCAKRYFFHVKFSPAFWASSIMLQTVKDRLLIISSHLFDTQRHKANHEHHYPLLYLCHYPRCGQGSLTARLIVCIHALKVYWSETSISLYCFTWNTKRKAQDLGWGGRRYRGPTCWETPLLQQTPARNLCLIQAAVGWGTFMAATPTTSSLISWEVRSVWF